MSVKAKELSTEELSKLLKSAGAIGPGVEIHGTKFGVSFFAPYRIAIRCCESNEQIKKVIENIQLILSIIEFIMALGFSIEFLDDHSPEFFAVRNDMRFYCSYDSYATKELKMFSIIGRVKSYIDNLSKFQLLLESHGIHAI